MSNNLRTSHAASMSSPHFTKLILQLDHDVQLYENC